MRCCRVSTSSAQSSTADWNSPAYSLQFPTADPGEVELDLYWRTLSEFTEEYEVQIDVQSAAGDVLGSTGGLLYADGQPSPDWPVNRLLRTPFRISLAGAPAVESGQNLVRLVVSPGAHEIELVRAAVQ